MPVLVSAALRSHYAVPMFRGPTIQTLLAAFAVALVACGSGDGGEQADAGANDPDAQGSGCTMPLEMGHCIDGATGGPCLDFEATNRQFMALQGGETVQPIVGPQGADMFVFAVRAAGVNPGTDKNPPMVSLTAYYGEEDRGGFLSWPIFHPDAGMHVAPQLYTVVFDTASLIGETMRITGAVTDPSGTQFCGETTIVVGELLPGDGGH